MFRINLTLFGALAAAWVFNCWVHPLEWTTRVVMHEGFLLTGLVAWALMAEVIVIASRPAWIEKLTGDPLDRLMAAHKALGWAMMAAALAHILSPAITALIPATPVPAMDEHFDMSTVGKFIWIWLHPIGALMGIAVSLWAAWIAWNDYRRFQRIKAWDAWEKSHKLWAWIFLGLALHSLRLMKEEELFMPLGAINACVTFLGCWASVRILRARPGQELRLPAQVVSVCEEPSGVELVLKTPLASRLLAGQFVYVMKNPDKEDPHPFTVAAIDREHQHIDIWIKKAGAWTESLMALKPGDAVFAEGPWGTFTPRKSSGRQVWVAGGFGIAPFAAWLKEAFDAKQDLSGVTLWWCIRHRDDAFHLAWLSEVCQALHVDLHVHESGDNHNHASTDEMLASTPQTLSVCGDEGLTRMLRTAWLAKHPKATFRAESY